MKGKKIGINRSFVGRTYEKSQLDQIGKVNKPSIVIVYGRRRVGKTELLEQTFRTRNILKFEGRENQNEQVQMRQVLRELSEYTNEPLLRDVEVRGWSDVFDYIYRYTKEGQWTIYFEELQWLAQYQDTFISELKYAWDNYFKHNKKIIVILCGSSPSFMIKNVAHSKSLYNRSQHEFLLDPFDINDTRHYMKGYAPRDIMDAYLTVGGIPVYLERLMDDSSVFLSLCKNSFTKNAFFAHEYKRIFISSLADNKNYQKIVKFLSKKRFAARTEIVKHLKLASGSNVTEVLEDLELCGFIGKYTPYNVGKNSRLIRYCIIDSYLQFYFKFIESKADEIRAGKYNKNPRSAIESQDYVKWLGYSFERFCRQYNHYLAELLGFSAVKYKAGAFFNRRISEEIPGYQIDLIFDRDDNVLTICEIKYSRNPVSTKVINDFEKKLEVFPNEKSKTIHKVLITNQGVSPSVEKKSYFDRILTLEDFFGVRLE